MSEITSPDVEDAYNPQWQEYNSIFDFTVKDLDGNPVSLEKFRGKVCLVVNVATYCGFAYMNHKILNELHERFKDQQFEILAFPCNQWAQEPACEVDLKEYVKKKGIKYQVFGKINVNGKNTIPLYRFLKSKQGGILGNAIKWNYTKFLTDRGGQPVDRYSPTTGTNVIAKDIEDLL
ncbi:glutathione peroxidase-like [Brevipalpus obovatus]|uniref:glutathione peroxidase-like n=1 Tax=Brevipalpus obovatus TaxID=246614 RepID=UPI003D9F1039